MLLNAGANIEEPNDENYTPLMEAAREGHAVRRISYVEPYWSDYGAFISLKIFCYIFAGSTSFFRMYVAAYLKWLIVLLFPGCGASTAWSWSQRRHANRGDRRNSAHCCCMQRTYVSCDFVNRWICDGQIISLFEKRTFFNVLFSEMW